MEVAYNDDKYARLEKDGSYTAGFAAIVVSAYRKRLQFLRATTHENDLYAMKSLCLRKFDGNRNHQSAIRLTDQFWLVVELIATEGKNQIRIIGIEEDR